MRGRKAEGRQSLRLQRASQSGKRERVSQVKESKSPGLERWLHLPSQCHLFHVDQTSQTRHVLDPLALSASRHGNLSLLVAQAGNLQVILDSSVLFMRVQSFRKSQETLPLKYILNQALRLPMLLLRQSKASLTWMTFASAALPACSPL